MDKKELSDMRVFPIIEGLEELEKEEMWEEARVILYHRRPDRKSVV